MFNVRFLFLRSCTSDMSQVHFSRITVDLSLSEHLKNKNCWTVLIHFFLSVQEMLSLSLTNLIFAAKLISTKFPDKSHLVVGLITCTVCKSIWLNKETEVYSNLEYRYFPGALYLVLHNSSVALFVYWKSTSSFKIIAPFYFNICYTETCFIEKLQVVSETYVPYIYSSKLVVGSVSNKGLC
jgi:hypothetical protein